MRSLHSDTVASANAATGAVNYKGAWSDASGAAEQGSSYSHNGSEWTLLVNLTDITSVPPSLGNSATWKKVGGVEDAVTVVTGLKYGEVKKLILNDSLNNVKALVDPETYEIWRSELAISGSLTNLGTPLNKIRTIIAGGQSYELKNVDTSKPYIKAEELGMYPVGHPNESADISTVFNIWNGVIGIMFQVGKTYNYANQLLIRDNCSICASGSEYTYFQYTGTDLSKPTVDTYDIDNVAVSHVNIIKIQFLGTKSNYTIAQVKALGSTEGIGVRLCIGRSYVDAMVVGFAGICCLITDGGDESRYTHGNWWRLNGRDSGQEAVIFAGGLDNNFEYLCGQWAGDTMRDTDYTQGKKTSKWLTDNGYDTTPGTCGVVFAKRSCEVIEVHSHNNRFGYANACVGKNGRPFRLRVTKCIGENSAGSFYNGTYNRVDIATMLAHTPSGVDGLDFVYDQSNEGLQVQHADILFDVGSGNVATPATCVKLAGSRAFFGQGVIKTYSGTFPSGYAVNIPSGTQNVNFHIIHMPFGLDNYGNSSKITGKFIMDNVDVALNTNSGNDIGEVEFILRNVGTLVAGNGIRYLSTHAMKNCKFINENTGKTNELEPVSRTIEAASGDGTLRTTSLQKADAMKLDTYLSGTKYHNFAIKSGPMVFGAGVTDARAWITDETSTGVTVKYIVTSTTDFEIRMEFMYQI